MSSEPALILDLASIQECVDDCSPPYAATRAIAASVLLEQNHGPRALDGVAVSHAERVHAGELHRVPFKDGDRRMYSYHNQLTEEAAEAVAFLVAHRLLGYIVFARLPTRTGADYRLRRPEDKSGDRYERLEVSGIGTGGEKAAKRLQDKLAQLAEYSDQPAGYAIVTDFRGEPMQVLVERYAS